MHDMALMRVRPTSISVDSVMAVMESRMSLGMGPTRMKGACRPEVEGCIAGSWWEVGGASSRNIIQ